MVGEKKDFFLLLVWGCLLCVCVLSSRMVVAMVVVVDLFTYTLAGHHCKREGRIVLDSVDRALAYLPYLRHR